jgi:4-diphosphocytidyl-2-C-methyl-D-erythritol kinase
MRRALTAGDANEIGRRLHNRLEEPARRLRPELDDYLRLLAVHRPAGQAMSGSGSTLFALCRSYREAARIAQELRTSPGRLGGGGVQEKGKPTVYLVRSCA